MRRSWLTRLAGAVAALLIALGGALSVPLSAAASDNVPGSPGSSCAGRLVKDFPVTRSTKYGSVKIYVYYSTANGGTNCIIAKKSGAWAGRKTYMNVAIWRDDHRASGDYPYVAYDSGAYRSYAGAVSIPRTNGRCISALLDLGSGSSAATQFNYWSKTSFACG
ncbi:hypothetical protein [Nakamurella deserti]|uniref:hypothetical protein n=1 Tax=Nakamurella deserti TaxID=2164074 RepID=UPI0013007C3E|nr:hypothetical protein [Nakamurella deserti]